MRKPLLPFKSKLYAIVDVNTHKEPLDFVNKLLLAGAQVIQLRDKSSEQTNLYDVAMEALLQSRRLLEQCGRVVKIIINDHLDICLRTGADGLHIGQDDCSPQTARSILGPEKIIGLSTHGTQQVANAPFAQLDYLGYGPIFPTSTKPDAAPELGLDSLIAATKLSPLPIVAIGGISEESAPKVLAAGASSVAMISALTNCRNLPALIAAIENYSTA